jgi:hypothetical protein
MPQEREVRKMADRERFDAVANKLIPESSDSGYVLMDTDLRVRAVNGKYEHLSMRQRAEMVGEFVLDLFPDDPTDPQASGTSQLAESLERAMRRRDIDDMPIMRYDISDPQNPHVFLPKLWTCSNTSIHDGELQIGVLHCVSPITSLGEALSGLALKIAGDEPPLDAAELIHVLSALAGQAEDDQSEALATETEQLRRALDNRDIIGQAKGMLMERYDIGATQAFDLLAKLSQHTNTRVEQIARRLVDLDHPND